MTGTISIRNLKALARNDNSRRFFPVRCFGRHRKPFNEELGRFLSAKVVDVSNIMAVEGLMVDLGAGESEAIILAQEVQADRILLDDNKARKLARLKYLPVIGTIGVLLLAKKAGLIPRLSPLLQELEAH